MKRYCSCHNKEIIESDMIDGSLECYCPINDEPCDTVVREK